MVSPKSTLGLEAELHLINDRGNIVSTTDKILERIQKTAPHAQVIPEIAENMIEFGSDPSTKVSVSARSLLDSMNVAVKAASKEKTVMLPSSTYPGKFEPKMRSKGPYKIKKKLFGLQFPISGKCVGFHLHHDLPEGSFDANFKNLKAAISKKTSRSLVQAYNFSVAIDPVLTTFMQSSPFYENKQLGKDSRMIIYRGGKVLGYPASLYSGDLEEFGDLPGYKLQDSEFLDMVIERYSSWKKAIRTVAPETLEHAQYESILETNWSPVKINPHGTLEIRGMDMNVSSLLFSISVVIKYLFQDIYEHSLHVLPSDAGVSDYFKEEKGKLFVPPDTYVRNKLQFLSAYTGMENDSINDYCKSFLRLARKVMPGRTKKLLLPFKNMVEEKKTTSDRMIEKARKLGYEDDCELTDDAACELALYSANEFLEDLKKTQDLVEEHQNA